MKRDKNKENIFGLLLIKHDEDTERMILYFISFIFIVYMLVVKDLFGPFEFAYTLEFVVSLIAVLIFAFIFAWPLSGITHFFLYAIREMIIFIKNKRRR